MTRNQKYLLGGVAAIVILGGTALASTYMARDNKPTQQAQTNRVVHYQPTNMASSQPAKPPCDDSNIVGTVAGGVAGGVIGNQFGSGDGKTIATTAGVLGGAALGNKFIPTRGVTCN